MIRSRHIKITYLILFIILAFSDNVATQLNISLPSGFRQILIFGFTLLILVGKRIRMSTRLLFSIIVLFFTQLPNNYGVPITNKSLGYLMTIQGILLFVALRSLQLNEKQTLSVYSGVVYICTFMAIVAFALYLVTGIGGPMRDSYALFREAGAFSSTLVVCVALSLRLYTERTNPIWFTIAVFLTLIIFLTVLKKNIMSLAIIWVIFGWAYTQRIENRILFYLTYGLTGAAFTFAFSHLLVQNFSENLDYLGRVGAESHVRLGMYFISMKLAINAFPFGTGAGSFGSLASILGYYSPLYELSGANLLGANAQTDIERGSHTILDTFWPHIIAEYGIIGSLTFISVFFYIIGQTSYRRNRVLSLMIVSVMFWEGLWLYNPETPLFVLLYWSILSLNCKIDRNRAN